MSIINSIKIIRPDDWHVHLREGNMLEAVTQHSSRVSHRAIVMPNLEIPITTSQQAKDYKNGKWNYNGGGSHCKFGYRDFSGGSIEMKLLNNDQVYSKIYGE